MLRQVSKESEKSWPIPERNREIRASAVGSRWLAREKRGDVAQTARDAGPVPAEMPSLQ